MRRLAVLCFVISLCSVLLHCESNPDAERCAKICADRYGECEQYCKLQYNISSPDYGYCKDDCEQDYNECIFNCYYVAQELDVYTFCKYIHSDVLNKKW